MTNLLETVQPIADKLNLHYTQRIVLAGFMGAGKSTVGRLLAAQLDWGFIDTDSAVEEKCGCTVAEVFARYGETAFRKHESCALASALGRRHVVIAIGGGAPEMLTNRLLMEQTSGTTVVFLDAPFEVLFDRCVLQEGASVRPVLLDAPSAAERFRYRVPFYRRCSQHQVQTAQQDPRQTAAVILSALQKG